MEELTHFHSKRYGVGKVAGNEVSHTLVLPLRP